MQTETTKVQNEISILSNKNKREKERESLLEQDDERN